MSAAGTIWRKSPAIAADKGDDWRDLAACRGMDTEMWFPMPGDHRTRSKAIAICEACPVRNRCRQAADELEVQFGSWGATTERVRRNERAGRLNMLPPPARTHCRNDHAYDEANTGYDTLGRPFCFACKAAQVEQRRAAREQS